MPDPSGSLPAGFDRTLAACLAPGEETGAAAVIQEALAYDDGRLGDFLEALAARLRDREARLTAQELRALLRRSASERSS